MALFSRRKDDTNPPIFFNLQPDIADGHALLVLDKKDGIKEKIQTNRYVIQGYPRDIDENAIDSEERQKQKFYVPISKNYLLDLNIGEHRRFIIGLPKRIDDLPLGLQKGIGKEFFGIWIKVLQGKETIEKLLQQDINNKDKILQQITGYAFYDNLMQYMGDIFKYHTEHVLGRKEVAVPKAPE